MNIPHLMRSFTRNDTIRVANHKPLSITRLHLGPPVFGGGGMSTVGVAAMLAVDTRTAMSGIWLTGECLLMLCWIVLVWRGRSDVDISASWPISVLGTLELIGAFSVGFGTLTSVLGAHPFASGLGLMSAVAFAGEACIVNFGAPRLLVTMLLVGAAPAVIACLMTGHPQMFVVAMLIGVYVGSSIIASSQVKKLLVTTIRAERENDHRARHDQLTGLLNRAGLEREVALIEALHPTTELVIYFIDLDHFKQINDRFGHAVGDQVLRLVSENLLALCAPEDVVARIGGDEFIIVAILDLVRPEEFGGAVLGAVNSVNHRIALNDAAVSASVGIAQFKTDGSSFDDRLASADMAMYRAKATGGGRSVMAETEPRT